MVFPFGSLTMSLRSVKLIRTGDCDVELWLCGLALSLGKPHSVNPHLYSRSWCALIAVWVIK